MRQIEKFMSDLSPQDMLSVVVPSGEEQTFYLYVDQAPAKIKVAFSVQSDERSISEDQLPIDFRLFVGKDTLLKDIPAKKDLFYEYSILSAAQFQRYGVTFSNIRSSYYKDVTFALKLVKSA
jgi:hypothetical protein